MKNVICYDAGDHVADRYTVVFLDQQERMPGLYACLAMSANPFHPQGFGQHSNAMVGSHLGKRIAFEKLPPDCQKLVRQDLANNSP